MSLIYAALRGANNVDVLFSECIAHEGLRRGWQGGEPNINLGEIK